VSLTNLAEAIGSKRHELISTDLFDTVLLRDHTIESDRLAMACRRVAPRLGVQAAALTRLRWSLQRSAYRAVAIDRPSGEASLAAICAVMAQAFGLDDSAASLLRQAEVDLDIEHLRPNRPLLELLDRAAQSGIRVIAVSDTYLGRADLWRILDAVAGRHCIAEVYSSADLGLTKHAGGVFAAVAEREGVPAERILHVGDSHQADVVMARIASWHAVHLPRDTFSRSVKTVGKALSLPVKMRSAR
jgi:FMN phosphatase YigB (HAD superfamily)